jgi:hypothetical protein
LLVLNEEINFSEKLVALKELLELRVLQDLPDLPVPLELKGFRAFPGFLVRLGY